MKSNGLELIKLKSSVQAITVGMDELEKSIKEHITKNSFVVAYMDNEVIIGRYENNNFLLHENKEIEAKYVQKIRVFNKTEELFFWRSNGAFKGRIRKDETGEDVNAVVAYQALYGTKLKESVGNFTAIIEDRGTEIILPFKITGWNPEKNNRILIKTINYIDYIDYNTLGQATYTDCRFVSFTDDKTNELN